MTHYSPGKSIFMKVVTAFTEQEIDKGLQFAGTFGYPGEMFMNPKTMTAMCESQDTLASREMVNKALFVKKAWFGFTVVESPELPTYVIEFSTPTILLKLIDASNVECHTSEELASLVAP